MSPMLAGVFIKLSWLAVMYPEPLACPDESASRLNMCITIHSHHDVDREVAIYSLPLPLMAHEGLNETSVAAVRQPPVVPGLVHKYS